MMWSNIVTRNIRGYGASLLTFGKIGAWCAKVGHPCCNQMLRAVAADVIVILNVRWWSWARLYCVWKVSNLSWRPVNALLEHNVWVAKNPDYEMLQAQILSGTGEDLD